MAKLIDEYGEWLQSPFTIEEDGEVISCNGDKVSGPDVFNLHFFRRCQSIVKEDV